MVKNVFRKMQGKLAGLLALVMLLSVGLPMGVFEVKAAELKPVRTETLSIYTDEDSRTDSLSTEGWAFYKDGATVDGKWYPGAVIVLDGLNMDVVDETYPFYVDQSHHERNNDNPLTIVLANGSRNKIKGTFTTSESWRGNSTYITASYVVTIEDIDGEVTICGNGSLEVEAVTQISAPHLIQGMSCSYLTGGAPVIIKDNARVFVSATRDVNDYHCSSAMDISEGSDLIIQDNGMLTLSVHPHPYSDALGFQFITSMPVVSANIIGSTNSDGSGKSAGWSLQYDTSFSYDRSYFEKNGEKAFYLELTAPEATTAATVPGIPSAQ